MAGAANCAKIRLTAQTMVWSRDAPELQTISFNGRVSELGRELSFQ
jgi:hypothetical protein